VNNRRANVLAGRADLQDEQKRVISSISSEGYHTPSRRQSCTSPAAGRVEDCPRDGERSGYARSTG
jgi:hypothetical protein